MKNTITNIKRLIGRKFAEPEVQDEVSTLGFKVVEGEDGRVAIKVNYDDEEVSISTEQAAAMMFVKLKVCICCAYLSLVLSRDNVFAHPVLIPIFCSP